MCPYIFFFCFRSEKFHLQELDNFKHDGNNKIRINYCFCLLRRRINDVCTYFKYKVFKLSNYRFQGKRWRRNELFDENSVTTLDTLEYTDNKIKVTHFAITIPIVQINSV